MFILVMFIFRRPRRIHCKHSISQVLTVKLIIILQKRSECYERCKIIQVNDKYHYLIQKNSETSRWLNNFAISANNVYDRNQIPYLRIVYVLVYPCFYALHYIFEINRKNVCSSPSIHHWIWEAKQYLLHTCLLHTARMRSICFLLSQNRWNPI